MKLTLKIKPLPQTTIDHSISIKQTVDRIRNLLRGGKTINFKDLFKNSKNRTEVIVGFLALLDLLKKKDIMVRQGNSFGDLEVEKI